MPQSIIGLTELAEELRSRRQQPKSYIDDLLAHIKATEPQIRAFIPETDRRGRLETEIAALRETYPEWTDRPPMYGVPIGVKDIIHVDGFPTRAGTEVPPHCFGGSQASIVSRFRELGAIVIGKTVTTEFALSASGPTRNPCNLDHTPGGSSSGSAAAVAAGMCPAAIGTQTNGSVIRPASFCGIVGFKPSFGRIPIDGVITMSRSADQLGLFTRRIADMRFIAPIVCNDWNRENPKEQPTIGVITGAYLEQALPATRSAYEDQVETLDNAGYEIKRAVAFDDINSVNRQQANLVAGEIALKRGGLINEYKDVLRERTVDRFREGFNVTAKEIVDARESQFQTRQELTQKMNRHGIDIWVSPAAPGPAPEGIEKTGDPIMNKPWTHAGVPAVTIPAGSVRGLPVGLQITAPYMADEQLLAWAERIETAVCTP